MRPIVIDSSEVANPQKLMGEMMPDDSFKESSLTQALRADRPIQIERCRDMKPETRGLLEVIQAGVGFVLPTGELLQPKRRFMIIFMD